MAYFCQSPLGINQAFTLAAGLIKSCPPENHIIATPNPPITIQGTPAPGATIKLTFTPSADCPQYYAAFISGLNTTFVPISEYSGVYSVEIPSNLIGVSYLVITDDGTKSDDSATVAGPAFLNFRFDENGKVIS
jgi:hypothetical protein